ncbi:HAD-IA family hydrolase [Inhella sp. 4Y17]|uniref:HAD-IA family hydrolase n=1 Tax=Inhella gelatinilytica TaxID=2795030 RepID=A0A931IWS6_9BURK|nr:HAD-IA family hydrolase [Inhella gelatinilytica]MBH9552450.1 HAD-IA family hydrolase [Inhella gelatinilytica]
MWPHRAETEEQLQQTVQDLFQSYQGDWGRFDQGLISESTLIEDVCARTGWARAEMQQLLDAVPDELIPQPGVVELVVQLKNSGVPLSFLSNMPAPLAALLKRCYPLGDWFETGVFSSDEKLCKPDARIFDRAVQRFHAQAGGCLLVDDHPINVEAARASGWEAILFTSSEALQGQLRERGLL